MPRNVIMPALGVAQDTGLIITWLKQSGDVVRIGDALMEIETDKAVMEVEAQADGYLTNVCAIEGEQVPVGQIVAIIAESADVSNVASIDSSQSAQKTLTDNSATNNSAQASISYEKEIIMPALGMAQDTGEIVAWRKSPGDPVLATDILLEVETDKSVMEVEAGHAGYIAAILADAHDVVPVGSTIAIISSIKPKNLSIPSGSASTNTTESSIPTSVSKTASAFTANNIHVKNAGTIRSSDGALDRVLASPKTRRLSDEQGLDLRRLVQHGVPQPYHVADLETLKALSNDSPVHNATTQVSELPSSLTLRVDACVPTSGHVAFMDWITKHKDISVPVHMIWLRYATAALRRSTERDSVSLIVEISRTGGTDGCYADADRARLSKSIAKTVDLTPTLVVRDYSNSPIVSVIASAHVAPVLTIRQEQENYLMSLDYRLEQFDENVAIEFITDFAGRVREPLRHLL